MMEDAGSKVSVKIKVSYTTDQELDRLIKLLTPAVKSCKVSNNKAGQYKKAYIELRRS